MLNLLNLHWKPRWEWLECVKVGWIVSASFLIFFAAAGCKKGTDNSNPDAGSATVAATNSSAPTEAGGAAPRASQPVDTRQELVVADTALKQRDYDKAADSLLKLRAQKSLTDEQAMAVRDRMLQLERAVAGGVASGDPKAKAAAEMLRESSRHR